MDRSTPIALAVMYLDQDPEGWKIMMADIGGENFMSLLQESLMWNARFIQKAAQDNDMEPIEMARKIIVDVKMREMYDNL